MIWVGGRDPIRGLPFDSFVSETRRLREEWNLPLKITKFAGVRDCTHTVGMIPDPGPLPRKAEGGQVTGLGMEVGRGGGKSP